MISSVSVMRWLRLGRGGSFVEEINYPKRYQQLSDACVGMHMQEKIIEDPSATEEQKRYAGMNKLAHINQINFLLSKWGLV